MAKDKGNEHIGARQHVVAFGNFFLSNGQSERLLKDGLELTVEPIKFSL